MSKMRLVKDPSGLVSVPIAAAELEMKYPALSQSLGGRRIFWVVAPVRRWDKLVKAVRQLDDKVTYDGGYGGLDGLCPEGNVYWEV